MSADMQVEWILFGGVGGELGFGRSMRIKKNDFTTDVWVRSDKSPRSRPKTKYSTDQQLHSDSHRITLDVSE